MQIFGTTHTDKNPVVYTKVNESASGAVGYRNIGGNSFRVRLQLVNTGQKFREALGAALPGWKTPGREPNVQRFSTEVYSMEARDAAVRKALAALMGNEPVI